MDNYAVKLTERALRDLDGIYAYISDVLFEPETADRLVSAIEDGILSLEQLPYRCPERNTGAYANQGYRQLLIRNYTVIYRIVEAEKTVIVLTVRYSRREPPNQ